MDRNQLLVQASELADLIAESEEAAAYREAQARLAANREASALLRQFRELREQVGEFQARKVPPLHYRHLLEQADALLSELHRIPDVQSFEMAEKRLNDLLDAVTARLSAAIAEPPQNV
ncbi:cell fate (sporulation/competence/biofilm development) regulator YlbF (YheA/YmcA/DUF963 family) [Alicyclobacillus sacchari]|uniref:Cell fate (Sporulation/competence/biofilm development) regulator YlbF (YheA/YmcA/DUF963 family) n=1 Tax=Alicyclobacillus sacchari TaxID=392010 RepID=A0A4R8LMX4_9BACL|nr:YlbF family regulator [Alicyclobacillus sacchari]TDY46685.1 cell fate (sporulation/competence/biofilm development) regulator YlbF (YheA/YmcA/DUF963 family) [Alicyclobacillus sacchari]GMA58758.1 hypothetical protein GCM10025858_32610 [Alicyclobacillus sacchari]